MFTGKAGLKSACYRLCKMNLIRTQKIFDREINSRSHSGAQLYVSLRGELMADCAFGQAGPGVAMNIRTHQLWMSAGKPITAIAILQLVARGELSLDTTVAEVIPGFAVNGKAAITIRHCLTHTAGFRGPLNNFTPGPWEDIITRVCKLKQEPGWVPGEKAGYHVGSSWFALGEIIARVGGCSFDDFVRNNVLRPAGAMRASFADVASAGDQIDLAVVTPDFPGNVLDGVARPGASARGPIRDLAMVYESILHHDGRLLPEELSLQMIRTQRAGMFDETFKQTIDWGYGFKLDSKHYGKAETYGYGPHASRHAFGHSGNQCSCAFADPAYDLIIAWCFNSMPGEAAHQERQNAINAAVYEDLGLATT